MSRIFLIAMLAFGLSITHAAGIAPAAEAITPLLVGSHVPAVSMHALDGTTAPLQDVVGGKPTILVFYRGSWCPFCNLQLSRLNGIQDQVKALGYQIIAVTPDHFSQWAVFGETRRTFLPVSFKQ